MNAQGGIAIKLVGGFPKAQSTGQCTTNNGWAGNFTADALLKSVLVAAKAADQKLKVTIEGCEGSWFKIKDVYVL